MKNNLISVLITNYNKSKFLHKSLSSVTSQDYKRYEIILYDDCSSDKTLDLLNNLAQLHKEIRLFLNDRNMGIGYVRNRIIQEAKGEFLAFFDEKNLFKKNRRR